MHSKKSPNPNGKEVEKGVETPRQFVSFSLENRYLDALPNGVDSLRCDVIKIAGSFKDCNVIDLEIIEGRSRLTVKASVQLRYKRDFRDAISDYKKELKTKHRLIDEGVLDTSVAFA